MIRSVLKSRKVKVRGKIWLEQTQDEPGHWKDLEGWTDQYEPRILLTDRQKERNERIKSKIVEVVLNKVKDRMTAKFVCIMLEVGSHVLTCSEKRVDTQTLSDDTTLTKIMNIASALALSFRFDTKKRKRQKFAYIRRKASDHLTDVLIPTLSSKETDSQIENPAQALKKDLRLFMDAQKDSVRNKLEQKIDDIIFRASAKVDEGLDSVPSKFKKSSSDLRGVFETRRDRSTANSDKISVAFDDECFDSEKEPAKTCTKLVGSKELLDQATDQVENQTTEVSPLDEQRISLVYSEPSATGYRIEANTSAFPKIDPEKSSGDLADSSLESEKHQAEMDTGLMRDGTEANSSTSPKVDAAKSAGDFNGSSLESEKDKAEICAELMGNGIEAKSCTSPEVDPEKHSADLDGDLDGSTFESTKDQAVIGAELYGSEGLVPVEDANTLSALGEERNSLVFLAMSVTGDRVKASSNINSEASETSRSHCDKSSSKTEPESSLGKHSHAGGFKFDRVGSGTSSGLPALSSVTHATQRVLQQCKHPDDLKKNKDSLKKTKNDFLNTFGKQLKEQIAGEMEVLPWCILYAITDIIKLVDEFLSQFNNHVGAQEDQELKEKVYAKVELLYEKVVFEVGAEVEKVVAVLGAMMGRGDTDEDDDEDGSADSE